MTPPPNGFLWVKLCYPKGRRRYFWSRLPRQGLKTFCLKTEKNKCLCGFLRPRAIPLGPCSLGLAFDPCKLRSSLLQVVEGKLCVPNGLRVSILRRAFKVKTPSSMVESQRFKHLGPKKQNIVPFRECKFSMFFTFRASCS